MSAPAAAPPPRRVTPRRVLPACIGAVIVLLLVGGPVEGIVTGGAAPAPTVLVTIGQLETLSYFSASSLPEDAARRLADRRAAWDAWRAACQEWDAWTERTTRRTWCRPTCLDCAIDLCVREPE